MHRWQRTLDAITRIHRAGLAPDTWPAALEAVARALDAGKAVMFGVDLRAGRVSDLRTHNIDGDATDRFAAYYHHLDPWLQGLGPGQRPREPIPGTRIISDAALRRTPSSCAWRPSARPMTPSIPPTFASTRSGSS